jgi:hypothetical protein
MDKPKEFAKVKLPTAYQQMYQPGTKNIFTGVRLLPEHAFGFPTYAYNPNLLHYTNGMRLHRVYIIPSWQEASMPRPDHQ